MLGVSRPSVREALRALQLMQVVEVRQGDGTYVSSLTPELLARPLEIILNLLQDVTYLQILEARRMIEPGIAALAALRIDEEGLGRLRECLSRSEQAIADPEDFLDADMDLHSAIVEATQNPLIVSLYASIAQLGAATRKRTAYISGVRESTLDNHRKIVEALASRDADRSREAMELHLSDVEERLRSTVERGHLEETADRENEAV
jgi:DNA-binding FadR family transcriptional regulator